jgi:hypothetical protein
MNWRDMFGGTRVGDGERYPAAYYDLAAKAIAAQIPLPEAAVLDYGCGDVPGAARLAEHCARLYLCALAPKLQTALRQRYASDPKIKVLSEPQAGALPDASLDMVLFNGLFQHLTLAQCTAAVDLAAAKLRLGGRLVVADVVPPHADPLGGSWAMVEHAYRGGFLLAALRGALARPRPPRRPFTTFTIPEMQRLLATHGFETRRAERNIGHNQTHMTFLAKRV